MKISCLLFNFRITVILHPSSASPVAVGTFLHSVARIKTGDEITTEQLEHYENRNSHLDISSDTFVVSGFVNASTLLHVFFL